MKITILVDNQAADGLLAEHGLAMWIEAGDWRILFDTGQGPALAHNAKALGIDLTTANALVLSHGHYDHTGNIAAALAAAPAAKVWCHPGVVQPRYSIREGTAKPIQMPAEAKAALAQGPEHRLVWTVRSKLISCRVGLTGPVPRSTAFEDTGGPFFLDPEGRRPDPIEDDQSLWLRTDDGLVVCAGCCHAGLVNTLRHIQQLNPGERIRAVIGGLHLNSASPERLAHTVAALREFAPELVAPCHCTGEAATAALREELVEMILPAAAGSVFEF